MSADEPWPSWKEEKARSFERAVRDIPQADLDRLIEQLTPFAKCPPYIRVVDEVGSVVRNWHRQPELPHDTPVLVWGYLQDKYQDERVARSTSEKARGFVDEFGLPSTGTMLALRRGGNSDHTTATEYFALRGTATAPKGAALDDAEAQPARSSSLGQQLSEALRRAAAKFHL